MKYDSIENNKWGLDIRETESEIWSCEAWFDTKDEAIEEGKRTAEGKFFRIGLCRKEDADLGIDVDYLIENIQEATYDTFGEIAEDYLNDVTKEDADELGEKLNEVYFKWRKEKGYEPSFYLISEEEKIYV